ncbi:hypothetical protein BGW41_005534 [Actinomortierella wolfii]|nr:hypothetical protein BGW41_005534 [Actinomortierella wolfii]
MLGRLAELSLPQRLAKCDITLYHHIGSGGYSTVYYARLKSRPAAAKCVVTTVTNKAELQQEVSVLQRLRDKHVINFYDAFFLDDQLLLLVMEFAEGGSLQRAIKSHKLRWPNIERIAQEIIRGLAYIHEEGIIHGDLKSSNILLTKYGEVKIADFGLATITNDPIAKARRARVRGSLRWMAPELLTELPRYSTKSDIYALAMVMWEMAAETTVPFELQVVDEVVAVLVQNGVREDLPATIPVAYRKRVQRCWRQNPKKRPSARKLVSELVDIDDSEWPAFQTNGVQWNIEGALHANTLSSFHPPDIAQTQPNLGPMAYINGNTGVPDGPTKRLAEDTVHHVDDMKRSAGGLTRSSSKRRSSYRKRNSRSSKREGKARCAESSVDETCCSTSKQSVTFHKPETSTPKPGKFAHKPKNASHIRHIRHEKSPANPIEYQECMADDSSFISELSDRMSEISARCPGKSTLVPRQSASEQQFQQTHQYFRFAHQRSRFTNQETHHPNHKGQYTS